MTTYTVINENSGEAIATGLTAAEAAFEVLTDDSREYDIRENWLSGKKEFDNRADAEACCANLVAEAMAESDEEDREDEAQRVRKFHGPTFEGYCLWSRHRVANRGWTRTVVYSLEDDRAAAEAEIFDKVINADWRHHPTVMTDQQYAEMLAEQAAELAADEE
jgi:hypothetical protein